MTNATPSSGNVFKDLNCENPEGLETVADLAAKQISILTNRVALLDAELRRHISHKMDAQEAVSEALSLCQHTPEEWTMMEPGLRDFKLKVFRVLEMRCLNLGYGTRGEPK